MSKKSAKSASQLQQKQSQATDTSDTSGATDKMAAATSEPLLERTASSVGENQDLNQQVIQTSAKKRPRLLSSSQAWNGQQQPHEDPQVKQIKTTTTNKQAKTSNKKQYVTSSTSSSSSSSSSSSNSSTATTTTPTTATTTTTTDQPTNKQANICAACMKPITERYLLMALEKKWHEDCLKCACCDCRLGEVGSSLFTHSDKILCRRDFLRIFGQHGNCAACKRSIPPYELVMRANTNAYHMDCFACQQCHYRFCVGDRFHLTESHKIICLVCFSDQQQAIQTLQVPLLGSAASSGGGGGGCSSQHSDQSQLAASTIDPRGQVHLSELAGVSSSSSFEIGGDEEEEEEDDDVVDQLNHQTTPMTGAEERSPTNQQTCAI